MPPLGECPRHIALAAAMVNHFECNIKNTNKTPFLPNFLMVNRHKKLNNFETRHRPSTHVLGATTPDPNPYATIKIGELSYILSYQM
jgi:hypothetical protein